MATIYDISILIDEQMPVWPGDPAFSRTAASSIAKGDDANVTRLDIGTHVGTHVDAPYHFVNDGAKLDEIPLEVFCGSAFVLDLSHVSDFVQPHHLDALPQGVQRVLIKTANSDWMGKGSFRTDYCALSPQAAQLLVSRGVKLVGIDAFSIAPFSDPRTVHHIILGAGICALETLCLKNIPQGHYRLWCLPLNLRGADGAPARAVLVKEEPEHE